MQLALNVTHLPQYADRAGVRILLMLAVLRATLAEPAHSSLQSC